MGLRAKFNLVMILALLTGFGLAGALGYSLVLKDAREGVLSEAGIMSGQATAIAGYTTTEIAPLLVGQFARRFLPQSVPAWAAQTNFRALQTQFPDYSFRTVMLNPTNPADLANDWQREIIDTLKRDRSRQDLVTERDTETGRILSVSRPIVISNPACLQCHSVPAAAPPTMIDLYGSEHGFGWTTNEVLGAQIVSVPMRIALERAHRTFTTVMAGLAAVFILTIVLVNILLHFAIIRPIGRIAGAATEVSLGRLDAPEVVVRGRDEVAKLAEAFNRMRRSVVSAMKLLGD